MLSTLSALDRLDYSKLTGVLTDRFDQHKSAQLALIRLVNRIRNKNESLSAYSADIEQLVSYAYPAISSDMRDVMTCDKFLRGLDSELRRHVKLARPTGYAQTLSVASEIESVLIAESDNYSSNRRAVRRIEASVTHRSDRDNSVDNVTRASHDISETRDSRDNMSRDMSRVTCWKCQKVGHFQRQCKAVSRNDSDVIRSRDYNNRKRRYSDSDRRRQTRVNDRRVNDRYVNDDDRTADESKDETIARLRTELDRLTTAGDRRRHMSENTKN